MHEIKNKQHYIVVFFLFFFKFYFVLFLHRLLTREKLHIASLTAYTTLNTYKKRKLALMPK